MKYFIVFISVIAFQGCATKSDLEWHREGIARSFEKIDNLENRILLLENKNKIETKQDNKY